ncbi:unnamed protein product [Peronospora farinosa]|uniref:EF-hand domain-containing protein n=1 Tax=Peronospora farinosa TaxID=134698 RepID=A0ABN8CAU1_9STRA|nr:unnamed protein product [Peronospora farinosa]
MACKTNKVKYLYLYMVLAVVVVLTLLSNSRTPMVRMIIAGSSASQHPLRDTRVKRQLRSNSNIKEANHGGDDDDERAGFDMTVSPIENVIASLKAADALEPKLVGMLKDANFQEWARHMDVANHGDRVKAAIAKISKLLNRYGEEKVTWMLEIGKYDRATQPVAKDLTLGLALKLTSDGNIYRGVSLLAANEEDVTKFLGSQSLKDWIDYCAETLNENPYSLLLSEYFPNKLKRDTDKSLAKMLAVAKGDSAAKNVATELEKQLMEMWFKNGESGTTVFKLLKLEKAGIDTQEWDTWVSYLVKRYAGEEIGEEIGEEEENELVLFMLRKDFADDEEKPIENDTEAPTTLKTAEELETGMARFDEDMEGLLDSADFKMWAKNVVQKSKTERDPVGAKMATVSALITRYGEEKVRSMLAAGKNVPATRSTAEHLELGLALKWTEDGRTGDVGTLLGAGNDDVISIMGSQLMKDWTYFCENRLKIDPYSLILKRFFSLKHSNKYYVLAAELAAAKDDGAAKNVATKLEKHLFEKWKIDGKNSDDVFEYLHLHRAGINMLDSPVWDTWVSYLVYFHVAENIGEEDKYTLVLSKLNVTDDLLDKSLHAATTPKGLDRAMALAAARQRAESARMRIESRKRPGNNDGEAPATKLRRNN